jgi:hypothetical protein
MQTKETVNKFTKFTNFAFWIVIAAFFFGWATRFLSGYDLIIVYILFKLGDYFSQKAAKSIE